MKIEVRKQSPRTWGVYVDGDLYEGGFFNRFYAEECAARLREEFAS